MRLNLIFGSGKILILKRSKELQTLSELKQDCGKYLLKYFYGFYFGAIWPPEASPHKSIFSEPI